MARFYSNENLRSEPQELSDRLIRVQKQNQPKSNTQVFVIREYER